MRDIIIALLVGFVILKLFRAFSNNGNNKQSYSRNFRNSESNRRANTEGSVSVENLNERKKRNDDDKGEYVEYEEIK